MEPPPELEINVIAAVLVYTRALTSHALAATVVMAVVMTAVVPAEENVEASASGATWATPER